MLALALSTAPAAEPEAADYDARIEEADRQHWSFQPVKRPAVPDVKDSGWCRNPIDRFILARLEQKGWQPAPAAAPRQFLRRVFLDVNGLPPTVAEQEAFLADSSDAAVERLVDDLLARPAYGERWGRHWLDLVRYAETNGYERDGTKPSGWRYRDYVIQSLNADKPYDRFVIEQLAGDELPDANGEMLIATGYCRLGPWDDEPADPKEDRFDQLDDIVGTTSQVFLGLTLGCARCHNHKFEPLTALDYYRWIAIFNTLSRPQSGRTDLDLPAGTRTEVAALAERDRQIGTINDELAALKSKWRSEFLQSGKTKLPPEAIAAIRAEPKLRNEEQKKLATQHGPALEQELEAALSDELRTQQTALQQQVAALRQQTPDLPRGYFYVERSPQPPVTHLLKRGKATAPGIVVEAGLPAVLVREQPPFPTPGEFTSGRRLTLARWIASAENPLAARVIVNRVWQFHFGAGLVRTPSDFGVMGYPPTHPELLDWLADWFVRDAGWSLKKLHRLILTSSTYRMSKQSRPDYAAADPENELLWRFPQRRLEVEAVCDSMLVASGELNPRMDGPSMYPHVPPQALEGHSDPKLIWQPFDEREASRRTVYAFIKRSLVVPLLETLDLCDTARTSPARNVTSVPPQALMLLNGDFVNRQSRHFAARLAREAGSDAAKQIDLAYRLTLCRPPTAAETAAFSTFLAEETAGRLSEGAGSEEAARRGALEQMCRVIFNLNEFVYCD